MLENNHRISQSYHVSMIELVFVIALFLEHTCVCLGYLNVPKKTARLDHHFPHGEQPILLRDSPISGPN